MSAKSHHSRRLLAPCLPRPPTDSADAGDRRAFQRLKTQELTLFERESQRGGRLTTIDALFPLANICTRVYNPTTKEKKQQEEQPEQPPHHRHDAGSPCFKPHLGGCLAPRRTTMPSSRPTLKKRCHPWLVESEPSSPRPCNEGGSRVHTGWPLTATACGSASVWTPLCFARMRGFGTSRPGESGVDASAAWRRPHSRATPGPEGGMEHSGSTRTQRAPRIEEVVNQTVLCNGLWVATASTVQRNKRRHRSRSPVDKITALPTSALTASWSDLCDDVTDGEAHNGLLEKERCETPNFCFELLRSERVSDVLAGGFNDNRLRPSRLPEAVGFLLRRQRRRQRCELHVHHPAPTPPPWSTSTPAASQVETSVFQVDDGERLLSMTDGNGPPALSRRHVRGHRSLG